MKIETIITQDNYDDTKIPMSFNDDKLENGWIEIIIGKEKYAITRIEIRNVAEGILASFKENY